MGYMSPGMEVEVIGAGVKTDGSVSYDIQDEKENRMVTIADRNDLMEIALSAEENAGYGTENTDDYFTICSSDIGEAMVSINKVKENGLQEDYYNIYTCLELDDKFPFLAEPDVEFYHTSTLDLEELTNLLEEITSKMQDMLVEMEYDFDTER